VVAGLFLPPISLGSRLFSSEYTRLTAESSQMVYPDGFTMQVDADALEETVRARLDSIPRADFVVGSVAEAWQPAAQSLPSQLTLKSPVYLIETSGEAVAPVDLAVPIPNDAEPYSLLDLYAWYGDAWHWVPSRVDAASDRITFRLGRFPQALAVFQAGQLVPLVGMSAEPGDVLPPEAVGLVTELYPAGLYLAPGGLLMGGPASLGDVSQYVQLPTSRALDAAAVQALLANAAARQAHVNALAGVVSSGGFAGINLDYQGVPAQQRDLFTALVGELATHLHSAGRAVVVTVPSPTLVGNGSWDTAGYEWTSLARVADRLLISLPLDPAAYVQGGLVDQILTWAVSQANRAQILAGIRAGAIQSASGIVTAVDGTLALAAMENSLSRLDGGPAELEPGSRVVVGIPPGLLEVDSQTKGYRVTWEQQGQAVTTWLPSGHALEQRLRAISGYHLGGFVLDGLVGSEVVNELVSSVNTYLASALPAAAPVPSITWAVQDASGALLGVLPGDLNDPQYAWEVVASPGAYTILGQVAVGQRVAALGSVQVAVIAPEPTETPAPEPTGTPEPTAVLTAVAQDSTPVAVPADADAVVAGDVVNLRAGPGTVFSQVGSLRAGTALTVLAVNPELTWLKVTASGGANGWIYAPLCNVRIRLADRPVEVVPTPTPAPTNTPGASAPAPVVVAPPAGGSFELGGHIRTWNYLAQMASSRMNWVKVQVRYSQDAAGLVSTAHANGYKIQLSALGSKDMVNQANFHSDYGAWVAGMAAAGADAIEVWNEPNIEAEWPLGQINPAAYTQLLCASYNAIKRANGNTAVISAAPAPTGYFGGCSGNGCDDLPFLQRMYNAGAANCMDYLGAHHNSGATSPSARSGHPADSGGGHHSWYFLPQTELYYRTFGGTRKLFYTEMGYASQEGVPTFSDWFGWARGTDNAEQAAWLAEAVRLSRSTGMVRCIIVWNIDFARYGDDPQDGYAIIRPDGSCPACGPLAAAMGY
jgi:uncharacterized protein YgiM (DUF1202 family)